MNILVNTNDYPSPKFTSPALINISRRKKGPVKFQILPEVKSKIGGAF